MYHDFSKNNLCILIFEIYVDIYTFSYSMTVYMKYVYKLNILKILISFLYDLYFCIFIIYSLRIRSYVL